MDDPNPSIGTHTGNEERTPFFFLLTLLKSSQQQCAVAEASAARARASLVRRAAVGGWRLAATAARAAYAMRDARCDPGENRIGFQLNGQRAIGDFSIGLCRSRPTPAVSVLSPVSTSVWCLSSLLASRLAPGKRKNGLISPFSVDSIIHVQDLPVTGVYIVR